VVTLRLQAERRTGSVRRPKTGVPPTVLAFSISFSITISDCTHVIVQTTVIASDVGLVTYRLGGRIRPVLAHLNDISPFGTADWYMYLLRKIK